MGHAWLLVMGIPAAQLVQVLDLVCVPPEPHVALQVPQLPQSKQLQAAFVVAVVVVVGVVVVVEVVVVVVVVVGHAVGRTVNLKSSLPLVAQAFVKPVHATEPEWPTSVILSPKTKRSNYNNNNAKHVAKC